MASKNNDQLNLELELSKYFRDAQVTAARVVSQGRENTSFIAEGNFGRVVLRIWSKSHAYIGPRLPRDITAELSFMQFCRDHGIPTPRIYPSLAGNLSESLPDGRRYLLLEYISGRSPSDFTPAMISQVATTMAKMHLIVADFDFTSGRSWPGSVIDMANERFTKFIELDLDPEDARRIATIEIHTALKRNLVETNLSKLPQGVIHGDIIWDNMKFQNNKLSGIFDFDDCRVSYFLEDIVKSLLFDFQAPERCLFGTSGENVEHFISAYETLRSLTKLERSFLPTFFSARILYQLTSYFLKRAAGAKDQTQAIDGVLERYHDHRQFFAA